MTNLAINGRGARRSAFHRSGPHTSSCMLSRAAVIFVACISSTGAETAMPRPAFRTLMLEAAIEKTIPGPDDAPLFSLKGKETRWIDVEADALRIDRIDVFLSPGPRRKVRSARIHRPDAILVLDFELQVAHRFKSAESRFPVWAEAMPRRESVERRARHLGRACDVFMSGETEVWSWNGIVMKKIVKNDGAIFRYEVTRIEENPAIADARFKPPPGFVIERNTAMGGAAAPPPSFDGALR